MSQPDRQEVLRRLHTKYDGMADYMRNLPTIPYTDASGVKRLATPNEAIREVDHNSDIGARIIKSVLST
jgi:hypothetical protein